MNFQAQEQASRTRLLPISRLPRSPFAYQVLSIPELQLGCEPGYPPSFFVSVASKELKYCVTPLFATHTRWPGSVASKGLRSQHNCGNGVAFPEQNRELGLRMPCVATVRRKEKRHQGAALQRKSQESLRRIIAGRYTSQGRF